MEVATTLVVCDDGFFGSVECKALTLCAWTYLGDIVKTEHHVLGRHGDRCTVGGVEDVVALKHQYLCLEHCLIAQWEVNSHLVAVEVGVESGTCQRMELYGLAFDKLRLEGLDTKTVKCRSTVEKHGVTFHHILKDVPDDRFPAVDYLLGALHCLHDTALDELTYDERLVELGSHQLRQTALSHLKLRTNDDNRTG